MEKQAKIRHLPFLTAYNRAQKRYGLQMKQDDFIEEGYNVWRDIGNQAPVLTRFFAKVPDSYVIELPFDAEFVEAVMIIDLPQPREGYDSQGPKARNMAPRIEADNIPATNQSLTSNKYAISLNYVLSGDKAIKITSPDTLYRDIMIVYRSILTSEEDGLPLLNDKEVAAIAAEVTRRDLAKQVFQGIEGKLQLFQYMTKEADRLMAAAKVDEYINDDALDQILDIKTSFDRKVYGRRFNIQN